MSRHTETPTSYGAQDGLAVDMTAVTIQAVAHEGLVMNLGKIKQVAQSQEKQQQWTPHLNLGMTPGLGHEVTHPVFLHSQESFLISIPLSLLLFMLYHVHICLLNNLKVLSLKRSASCSLLSPQTPKSL